MNIKDREKRVRYLASQMLNERNPEQREAYQDRLNLHLVVFWDELESKLPELLSDIG